MGCVHTVNAIQRQEYYHKMMYMVMGDKNYVGPVEQVLTAPGRRKKQILDIGTGSGIWSVFTLIIGRARS